MKKIVFLAPLAVFFCLSLGWAEGLAPGDVDKLFLEGKYEKVISEADALIEARSSGREVLYYLKGLSQLKLNRFSEARASFQEVVSRYPRSKTAFDASVGIGDAYFLEGNINEAARSYNEVLNKYPNDRNISDVRSKLNDCYQRMSLSNKTSKVSTVSAASKLTIPTSNITPRNVAPVSAATSLNYLSVQIGSFKNRNNADRLSRDLAAKGYDSHVEGISDAKGSFYRVKIGRCASRSEAERLESQLRTSGYSTKICDYDESR